MEGKHCVISCDCKPSFLVSTCVGYTFARCYSHKHNKEIGDWHNFRNTVGVPKSQVLQKEMEGKQSIRWEIQYMSNQVQLFTNRLYKSKAPATSTCFTSNKFSLSFSKFVSSRLVKLQGVQTRFAPKKTTHIRPTKMLL